MYQNNYIKIREYENILPNFKLAFIFAKHKGNHFKEIYYSNSDDVLQTIALSYLEVNGDMKKINNRLSYNLYYLHKYLTPTFKEIMSHINKQPRKKKYHCKPKKISTCDLCGKEKMEYMRKKDIPGKTICGACHMKLRREDKRRNLN